MILEDGSVRGTFPYVTSYTEFSGDASEQEGHYLSIDLGEQYSGKQIGMQRNDQEQPKKAVDLQWTLRIPSAETTFSVTADDEPILTLNFKGAKLEQKGGGA